MKRLGIDTQTVFGMPPLEHVTLAADLKCGHISCGLTGPPWQLEIFPDWSLRDDPALRREMAAALRDRGISLTQGDGFSVRPGVEARDLAADLDIFAELGAAQAGGVCMERDSARALDQFAALADMTEERNMHYVLEFAPPHAIGTLEQAVSMVRALGKPNVRIIIDAMHLFRSGAALEDLRALDPAIIGYVQLCDVPMTPAGENYFQEACFERLLPGEGELPLAGMLAALPKDLLIGLEIPALARVEEGRRLPEFAALMVEAAVRLLGLRDGAIS